jgi:hypothetical protein
MFQDTFAVEMLLAGVPIDQVSLLLGQAYYRPYLYPYQAVWVEAKGTAIAVSFCATGLRYPPTPCRYLVGKVFGLRGLEGGG